MPTFLEERAEVILNQTKTVTLASVNEEGFPRPFAMTLLYHEGIQTLYFETIERKEGPTKTKQFLSNPKAGVEFHDGSDTVTIFGEVEVITDRTVIDEIRSKAKNTYISNVENEQYRLLKFKAIRTLFAIDGQFKRQEY